MKYFKTMAFAALLLISLPSTALDSFLELQSGALMGDAHFSYGVSLADRHDFMAGLGHAFKDSNHERMGFLSMQYLYRAPFTVQLKSMAWQPLNFGIGLIKSDHKQLFTSLPKQYPSGYYPPSSLHFLFNYQNRLQINKHWQASFNISSMDVAMLAYVRQSDYFRENYKYFGLNGITTWGFGVRYDF